MKRLNIILALAVCCMSATADICNIAGYIFDESGPVADGVKVSITNLDLDVTYNTTTGNVWQHPHYYLQTITCTVGKDTILVRAFRGSSEVIIEFVTKTRLEIINLTLPTDSITTPDEMSQVSGQKGGGGGGGSGAPIRVVDILADEPYNVSIGGELVIYTTDEWFNVQRYILNAERLGDNRIRISFAQGSIELGVGEEKETDINGDGIPDYRINLESFDGDIAMLRFYKAWNPVLMMEGVSLEGPEIIITPEIEEPKGNTLLIMMLVLLCILTIILIIQDRGSKR